MSLMESICLRIKSYLSSFFHTSKITISAEGNVQQLARMRYESLLPCWKYQLIFSPCVLDFLPLSSQLGESITSVTPLFILPLQSRFVCVSRNFNTIISVILYLSIYIFWYIWFPDCGWSSSIYLMIILAFLVTIPKTI